MDRLKQLFSRKKSTDASEYAPLHDRDEPTGLEDSTILPSQGELPFSWVEYGIFLLLGVAMLWAW